MARVERTGLDVGARLGTLAWARYVDDTDRWAHAGGFATVSWDDVGDIEWSRGLHRIVPDGQVGGDACLPVEWAVLPGGLVPLSAVPAATLTTMTPAVLGLLSASHRFGDGCWRGRGSAIVASLPLPALHARRARWTSARRGLA